MFRNILSSRGLIVGMVFFVVSVGGSLLYSWHVWRDSTAEMERTNQFLQQLKDKKETRTTQDKTVLTDAKTLESAETSMETDDTASRMSEKTESFIVDQESVGLTDAFLPDDSASEDETVEVPVSPFGFGPYPVIPEGFPFDNPWDVPTTNATFELMHRVQIKLWNEGKRPEGMTWEKGRVYPIYPNTIYVEWDYFETEDGSMERYISEVTAGTLSPQADALLDEGIVPPGVTVYKYSEAGIDPYSYLGLQ